MASDYDNSGQTLLTMLTLRLLAMVPSSRLLQALQESFGPRVLCLNQILNGL